jgi:hypothetical protein
MEKNNSYLHTVATELIKLMSSKADPNQKSSTHYVALEWLVGFGDTLYYGNLAWAKRNDPEFGPGSFGQISRLVPESGTSLHNGSTTLNAEKWWMEGAT